MKVLTSIKIILFAFILVFLNACGEGMNILLEKDVLINRTELPDFTSLLGVAGAYAYGRGIGIDSSGNSYAAGYTNGNLDGETKTGSIDVFIIKYDISGNKQWTRLSGVSGGTTYGRGIAVDSSGNSYVTGETTGNLDGQTKTGTWDVYVIKFDASGNKQWTRLLGVAGASTRGQGIGVDSSGNIYVAGYTNGNLDGQTITGTNDVFVIKYDASGNKQWTSLLGVSGISTYARAIAVDSSGNSYVTGETTGNLDGQILNGMTDGFVIKYDASGNKQWTRLLGASGVITTGKGISVDSSGNSYVTGWTSGNLDGQILSGTNDVFVIKYDISGNKQWTRLLGVSGASSNGSAIGVDSSGNCYVGGDTTGNLDGQINSGGTRDVFVIKYDTSGNKQWTILMGSGPGTTSNDYGISVNSAGRTYVTGHSTGNFDGEIYSGGIADVFVTTKMYY